MRFFGSLALAFTLVILAAGCGGSGAEKGEETPMPQADGKSDTWWAPTLHGELRWGAEDRGTFDGAAGQHKFHAWDFTLSGAAEVTLTTAPVDPNVDTVAYLYRWDPAAESWGSYLARNDDHGGSIGSQIARGLDAGGYRLVVKGYKDSVEGTFTLLGTCAGAGCPAAGPPNGLSAEEEDQVVNAVDNLCGDTYCEGDFNWWVASISCVWGTGCTIAWDAKSYYEEDAFPSTTWLEQFDAGQLQASGTTSDQAGPYAVSVDKIVDRASEGYWARVSCELAVPYASAAELVDPAGRGDWPTQTFSDQLMDCVGSLEGILFTLLPSAVGP
ncbi:MAG: hypothetical protein P1V51_23660 [Deltaproteobacteria bacterium]|nr:hypothetical protein [Deltaproteobacteria bacterium]